jgi:transcriptional regulator with XRE-family HTH domain
MFSTAFNETLNKYKIRAKDLSLKSGVRLATISDFRLGKIHPKTDTLEALINALPVDAKNYLIFKALVTFTDNDISILLSAIASELRKSPDQMVEAHTAHELVLR